MSGANLHNVVQLFNTKRIELFDEEQIFVTIAAINVFGAATHGVATEKNLHRYEPEFVISCLSQLKDSGRVSNRARLVCKQIIDKYRSES